MQRTRHTRGLTNKGAQFWGAKTKQFKWEIEASKDNEGRTDRMEDRRQSVTFKTRQLTIIVIIIIMLIIISQRFINKYLNTQPSYARKSKHNGIGRVYGRNSPCQRRRVMCLAGGIDSRCACVCFWGLMCVCVSQRLLLCCKLK